MDWIPRDAALSLLRVKPQTLYAYVSRGLISARAHETDPRGSLYSLADIQAFLKRRRAGRARSAIARASIAWGDPVMETTITTVQHAKLIYRGQNAIELAAHATLEQVAALLWNCGPLPSPPPLADDAPGPSGKERLLVWLAHSAAGATATSELDRDARLHTAAQLLVGACTAVTATTSTGAYHERLAGWWGLDQRGGDLLRRALVLVADHELNPSSFAARVAASTGASLAACALAGCATLTGPRHGEASSQALHYLRNALRSPPDEAFKLISTGKEPAALGHALYPGGDTRARALLEWLDPANPIKNAIAFVEDRSGHKANIDMALAALAVELELPDDAPFLIFACGRMVGWIAHAIEQLDSGKLIRPRATYSGL